MDFGNKSDKELVDWCADSSNNPEGAHVEMMRRLKDAIAKADRGTQRFNFVATCLSMVMLFMAMGQLVVSIFPPENELGRWVVFIMIVIGIVSGGFLATRKSFTK